MFSVEQKLACVLIHLISPPTVFLTNKLAMTLIMGCHHARLDQSGFFAIPGITGVVQAENRDQVHRVYCLFPFLRIYSQDSGLFDILLGTHLRTYEPLICTNMARLTSSLMSLSLSWDLRGFPHLQ